MLTIQNKNKTSREWPNPQFGPFLRRRNGRVSSTTSQGPEDQRRQGKWMMEESLLGEEQPVHNMGASAENVHDEEPLPWM